MKEQENASQRSWIESLTQEQATKLRASLTDEEASLLMYDWRRWARPNQITPPGSWYAWLILAGRGWGKALAIDTPIPTPDGWTSMGALQAGDFVFDPDGSPTRVLAAHAVMIGRECFRVSFSDGASVIADADHIWVTSDRRTRKAHGRSMRPRVQPQTRTTAEIRATLFDRGEVNHAISCCAPLRCAERSLPIDPYLLGCWLGDGSSNGAEITTADDEIIAAFESAGYLLKKYSVSGRSATYGIGTSELRRTGTDGRALSVDAGFRVALRAIGVLGSKAIPKAYLRASVDQRWALMHGLMDTDGYCDPSSGSSEFCSTNRALADGFQELALSLGLKAVTYDGRATLNGKDCGPKWRVCFTAHSDIPLFRLSRKLRAQPRRGPQAKRAYTRYIVAVDPVPSVPVRCIEVQSASRLFLCGRAMIATHNTRTAAEVVREAVETNSAGRIALIAETSADARDVMVEGEALAVDTPIAVPSGWTTIGALRVGDQVFAGDGTATSVVAVSPVWPDRPCYVVHASEAAPITADARHKWVASSRSERRDGARSRQSIRTTEDMARKVRWRRADLCEFEIPLHGALDLPPCALPVAPYTLGAWLGDGDTRGHGTFTCHERDAEVVERIRSDGFVVRRRRGKYEWGIGQLRARLRPAGLVQNKHIPPIYMRASAEQRLDLLRGLMDTDGYASARGQCAFDNTNHRLVDQVRELLLTLGFKPGVVQSKPDRRGHKTMYRVVFTPGKTVPFCLRRKAARCKGVERSGRLVRDVVACTVSVPVRCIQVSHESGTFLAGNDLVVTHNSGLLAISPPWNRPKYEPSKRRLTWDNGAMATCYDAREPDQLRGPQHDFFWADELAKFRYQQACWDNLLPGLRLGVHPRGVIATTPRPTQLIKALVKDAGVVVTRGRSTENLGNLAATFRRTVIDRYAGTRLGRQELDAEILEDMPGALWIRRQIEECRVEGEVPPLKRIVVGVDPAATSGDTANENGIIVVGIDAKNIGYVIDDWSARGSPDQWARKVVAAYRRYEADRVVVEVNQGGEMVASVLRSVEPSLPIEEVRASKGKYVRAEPVAALYEQGRVRHAGTFADLEDQMCGFTPERAADRSDGYSPDRVDALVWALSALFPTMIAKVAVEQHWAPPPPPPGGNSWMGR